MTATALLADYHRTRGAIDARYAGQLADLEAQIADLARQRDAVSALLAAEVATLDADLCAELHVKLDADGRPVPRQGAPRGPRKVEPTLTPPSPTVASSQPSTAAQELFVDAVSDPATAWLLDGHGYTDEDVSAMSAETRKALADRGLERGDVDLDGDGFAVRAVAG